MKVPMTNHRGAGKAISNHAGNNMQEATENKVHDVLAARDEKHARFKERHHVLQQPNNAVEKHVLVEKEPLEKAHGKAKLKSMRAQNDKLKQKVNSQHSEIVYKRTKLAHYNMSCTTRDAGARQELREECQSIRVHQERYLDQLQKIHRASRTAMTPQRMMVLIQVEFLSEDDDDEWSKWAKFVEVEIEAMTKEAALYRGALQELDAILQAYKRHYGSTWDEIDEEESYDGAEEGHSVATYSSLV